MPPRALTKCGVYDPPGSHELAVLALADEFRGKLCELYNEQHRAMIRLRNQTFPTLLPALENKERWRFRIYRIEEEIRAYHSEVRDRNAVTPDQAARLEEARDRWNAAFDQTKAELAPWYALQKEFKTIYNAAENWQHIKMLEKRLAAWNKIVWPAHLLDYATLWQAGDMQVRELGREYQNRGLHATIRSEIVDASQPKIGRDGPGMRYAYDRRLDVKPWTKISIQFGLGGLSVADAIAGKNPQFSLTPVYVQHKPDGDETNYLVRQRIGVGENIRTVEYSACIHRELPLDAVIKRWSLVIDGRERSVVPLISGVDFSKPVGKGTLCYRVHWTVGRSGIAVATFHGDHVNEQLVIPNWLVDRRMAVKDEQQRCDLLANEFLTQRGLTPAAGGRQGVEALRDYVADKHGRHERVADGWDSVDWLASQLLVRGLKLNRVSATGSLYFGWIQGRWVRVSDHRKNRSEGLIWNWSGGSPAQASAWLVSLGLGEPAQEPAWFDGSLLLVRLEHRLAVALKTSQSAIRCIESIYRTVASRVCSRHSEIVHHDINLKRIKKYKKRDLLVEDRLPPRSREIMFAVAPGKLKALLKGYGLPISNRSAAENNDVTSRMSETSDVFTSYVESLKTKTGTKENREGRRSQCEPEDEAD